MNEYIETVAIPAKRDIATITAEIRMINQQTVQYVVRSVVEVGRRLCEAKSMLPHGQWGPWLRDEVGFSKSTAQNYMKIFEEYSADQLTLDGAVANSQTLGNLSYTKALKLLALPAEEREEFVEKNDVEHMSTRELDRAIKERDEARQSAEAERERAEQAEKQAADLREAALGLQLQLDNIGLAYGEELQAEEQKARMAEKRAAESEEQAKALSKALGDAKEAASKATLREKELTDQLEELRKNPVIPKAMKDKLKEEVSSQAKKEAQKDLDKERSKVAELEQQIREAGEARKRAEAEAERIRKELATSAPELVRFKLYFKGYQEQVMEAQEALREVAQRDRETGAKLQKAMLTALESCIASVKEVL